MFYFSGTGNSEYIAKLFGRYMNAPCYSIEEKASDKKIDFGLLMSANETIGFCYPIYGSRVPRIMREFVQKYMEFLKDRKLIILCTQMIFSGDGARVFTDLFPKNFMEVIYAEHFLMPNNVVNFFLLPLTNTKKIKRCVAGADQKMQIVCDNINKGIVKKRGFNIVSRLLGLVQGSFMPGIEKKALNSVHINNDCTQCLLCVSLCPMKNLELQNGKITHRLNCTMCYRCINNCPQKAITVFFHEKVKVQYKNLTVQ